MAQGNHKLSRKSKSNGSMKHKKNKQCKHVRKGTTKIENNKHTITTTKVINKKNERLIAAKASNAGTSFFLNDITKRGKDELQRQTAVRNKKETKVTKLSGRLQQQLNKLQTKKNK